jgi:plasmid stabilization system protein ParE
LKAVIWSPSALDDLQGIRDYIDRFNPKAARDIAARLIDGGNGLKNFPQRGRPVGDNLREWTLVYPYIIRYEIVGDEVHVLGVRHGRRLVLSDEP